MDLFGLSYISAYRLLKKLEDAGKLRREEWAVIPIRVGMIGARESKFFHHLSIILSCKNSLFTCKNYCKMVKGVKSNPSCHLQQLKSDHRCFRHI